jgi:hypothetical protein
VRQAPLDDPGRELLTRIHQRTLGERREVLPNVLVDEFDEIFEPGRGESPPSASVLRFAQHRLSGWLEGLFHGIQASLMSQQMAAQNQLAEMQRKAIPAGPQEGGEDQTGLYL